MREIEKKLLSAPLIGLLDEPEPLERDIGIFNDGSLIGVVISPGAYRFFLRKLEEEQDMIDQKIVDEFRQSGEAAQ